MGREIEAFTEGETGEVSINAVYDRERQRPLKLVIRDDREREDVLSSWQALPDNIDEYQVYLNYQDNTDTLILTDIVITKNKESYAVDIGESGFFSNIASDFIDEEIRAMINELYGDEIRICDWHYYMRVLLSLKHSITQAVRSRLSVHERLRSPL